MLDLNSQPRCEAQKYVHGNFLSTEAFSLIHGENGALSCAVNLKLYSCYCCHVIVKGEGFQKGLVQSHLRLLYKT